jgi:hypothetical protein
MFLLYLNTRKPYSSSTLPLLFLSGIRFLLTERNVTSKATGARRSLQELLLLLTERLNTRQPYVFIVPGNLMFLFVPKYQAALELLYSEAFGLFPSPPDRERVLLQAVRTFKYVFF